MAFRVQMHRNIQRIAADYPACQPRVDPNPEAWLANLRREEVRWLHAQRYPNAPFPPEAQWAGARPDLFRLRYADETNRIYELAPAKR